MTDADERAAVARWLASPAAAAGLEAARLAVEAHPADPLAAGSLLRRQLPGLDPLQAAAVLEQATLAALARARYGIDGGLLLTRDGLEQGTRPDVADRRARRFAHAGARRVLDLTAGLGFDAAFLRAGLIVTAVERDPVVAQYLAQRSRTRTRAGGGGAGAGHPATARPGALRDRATRCCSRATGSSRAPARTWPPGAPDGSRQAGAGACST